MGHLTAWFDREFLRLQSEWRELIQRIEPEEIYQRSSAHELSIGEQVLRSARAVEQTFGGITASLWDNPFEWTLPENLATPEKLLQYFDEVEATRQRGFALFKYDEDLMKEVMTPSGTMQLGSLLLDTLVRARHHQLNAREVCKEMKAGDVIGKASRTATVSD